MTTIKKKAIEEIEKLSDEQVVYVIQILRGMNGLMENHKKNNMEVFQELEKLIKKGTVTDYQEELSSYRDSKYGI